MDDDRGDEPVRGAHLTFAGIVPSTVIGTLRPRIAADRRRLGRTLFAALPIVLVSTVAAVTLNLTGPVEPANAKPIKPKGGTSDLGKSLRGAFSSANSALKLGAASAAQRTAIAADAPVLYSVVPGDTVSDISVRYGLSTASVLALNGLSWSSLIYPGQQLKLTKGAALAAVPVASTTASGARYTITAGDTISAIANRFSISTQSLLSANGLGWASIIYPGQTLAIPGSVGAGGSSSPSEAVPAAAATATSVSYTIVAGDTISAIATRFGITSQELVDANGLSLSSVIYADHSLIIPVNGASPVAGAIVPTSVAGSTALMNQPMRANAAVIVQVGRELGVPEYGLVIVLAAAMQESSLRNINWGDRDSVGLFQQRPSAGWGSPGQLTTPSFAARLFFGGPSNPNAGTTRGLLDIPGWQTMSLTQAAQAVQNSAFPDAYAKWEASARVWLTEL